MRTYDTYPATALRQIPPIPLRLDFLQFRARKKTNKNGLVLHTTILTLVPATETAATKEKQNELFIQCTPCTVGNHAISTITVHARETPGRYELRARIAGGTRK